jgi:hypothetical protein
MEDQPKDDLQTPTEPVREPAQAPTAEPEEPTTETPTAELEKTEEAPEEQPKPTGKLARFKHFWHRWWANPKKRYGTIGGLVLVLAILFAIPFTRYEVLGLVIKKPLTVTVLDDKTHAPVSGVFVSVDGKQATTNAAGKASVKARLGKATVSASKKYYQSSDSTTTIKLSNNEWKITVRALGRQLPAKVVNKVTGKPVAGAVITVNGSQSKTSQDGQATIVVPSDAQKPKATISLSGYNSTEVNISLSEDNVAVNTFTLTPAGIVYFLSNKSGKIDVVKSNLDGSGRQTVVAGTGNEDNDATSLLAARDWKYVSLQAKRTNKADTNGMYIIDTTKNDKLVAVDEGNATFTTVGWSGHNFIYVVQRTNVQNWEPNAQALKSYNAETGKLTTLEQSAAEGTSMYDYAYSRFGNVYAFSNEIVFGTQWAASYNTVGRLNGKSVSLVSIRPDGSGRRVIKDFPVPTGNSYYNVNLMLHAPQAIYAQVSDGTVNSFYEYKNGKITDKPDLNDVAFYRSFKAYLVSPSGESTFWTEQRDGKNTLLLGDKDGGNEKTVLAGTKYNPYGWYGEDYLLVSKEGSELFIMAKDGSGTQFKITDYFPSVAYYSGYGGGYGGE